jgi:hypothetical protein
MICEARDGVIEMSSTVSSASSDVPLERLIRRYANRKLYDTVERRFTSLRQIERLVRDGQDVRVVDHESGADVTAHALGRVLGNRRESDLPLAELIRMPARVARAVVRDDDDENDEKDELRQLRDQVQELTRMVAALVSESARPQSADESQLSGESQSPDEAGSGDGSEDA